MLRKITTVFAALGLAALVVAPAATASVNAARVGGSWPTVSVGGSWPTA